MLTSVAGRDINLNNKTGLSLRGKDREKNGSFHFLCLRTIIFGNKLPYWKQNLMERPMWRMKEGPQPASLAGLSGNKQVCISLSCDWAAFKVSLLALSPCFSWYHMEQSIITFKKNLSKIQIPEQNKQLLLFKPIQFEMACYRTIDN